MSIVILLKCEKIFLFCFFILHLCKLYIIISSKAVI
nr:MAG TPA: hypothetical protein [Caudoviricetes sp.]